MKSNRLTIVVALVSLAAIVALVCYYRTISPSSAHTGDTLQQPFALKRYDAKLWRERRSQLVAELKRSIGIERLWKLRGELKVEVASSSEKELYRIENIVIEPVERWYVSGSVFIPKDADTPKPAVLLLPGHFGQGSRFFLENKRISHALASMGFVVLAIDMYGFPERANAETKHEAAFRRHGADMWAAHRRLLKLGMAAIAIPVFEATSALDYLTMRPEVDRYRIGVMGLSGGATSAIAVALLDERVRAVAAAGYSHSFIQGCPCGLLPPEWRDDPQLVLELYAALAPKYALFIAEKPVDMRFVRHIYTILGARRKLHIFRLFESGQHCELGPQGRGIIVEFFAESLGYPDKLPSDDELLCFPEGMPQDRMTLDELVSLIERGSE